MYVVLLQWFTCCRHAIEARVHLANGHQMLVEFDSASTADEVGFLKPFPRFPSYPHMQLTSASILILWKGGDSINSRCYV